MPTKTEQVLIDANAIVAQFVPLVGIVGIGVRATIALLRANGRTKEAEEFEEELRQAEAARADLRRALDDFYSKYPMLPQPGDPSKPPAPPPFKP